MPVNINGGCDPAGEESGIPLNSVTKPSRVSTMLKRSRFIFLSSTSVANASNFRKRFFFKRSRIDLLVTQQMQFHIENCRCQVFDGCESLIESPGAVNLINQGLRNWFAGLIMQRKAL